MKDSISSNIPKVGINLAKYTGKQLIDRIGEDIIKDVVASILCGGNVRSLTEGLTQKRILLSNVSMLVTFIKTASRTKDFTDIFYRKVFTELSEFRLSQEQKLYLKWMIGLTGKSIQNVLRSEDEQYRQYLNELDKTLRGVIEQSRAEFGELNGVITIEEEKYFINWPSVLHLFLAIGAQTLALRGSEKSMYGKLFEKLILGSLLTLLGFERIDPERSTKSDRIFWLSQREDKRESDATLLFKPGIGARFDIGFIGPGNPEISLDKVSRFEREMDFGRQKHFMSTIIIVDRIGEGSRIVELARKIDGSIVQMSMTYWVKEVALILHKRLKFDHPLVSMDNEKSLEFIKQQMKLVDLNGFINGLSYSEGDLFE